MMTTIYDSLKADIAILNSEDVGCPSDTFVQELETRLESL